MSKPFKYTVINLIKTGMRIEELRKQAHISVKDLQDMLELESPQAIYKWQWGQCLPTLENLVNLAKIFDTTIDNILVYG